jgi:hypothetical protein
MALDYETRKLYFQLLAHGTNAQPQLSKGLPLDIELLHAVLFYKTRWFWEKRALQSQSKNRHESPLKAFVQSKMVLEATAHPIFELLQAQLQLLQLHSGLFKLL